MLPTKIERSMWYYSLKNLKRESNKVDFEELEEVKLRMFQIDYRIDNKTNFSFEIPILNRKVVDADELFYCSLSAVTKLIAKAQTQQRSRRSTIDFNELSDLTDEDDSIDQSNERAMNNVNAPINVHANVNRSEAKPVYHDQPIPAYNDDRETESLRLISHDDSQEISGMGSGDIDWSLDISRI